MTINDTETDSLADNTNENKAQIKEMELDAPDRNPVRGDAEPIEYGVMQYNGMTINALRYERKTTENGNRYDLVFRLDRKIVARAKAVEEDQLSLHTGQINAERIRTNEASKATLSGASLQYQRIQLLEPEEKAVVIAETSKNWAAEAAAQKEENQIEADKAVMRASEHRRRERIAYAQWQKRRLNIEHIHANDSPELLGTESKAVQNEVESEERLDLERREAILSAVQKQFHIAGARYMFRDVSRTLAFKDKGGKLVTASRDDRAAVAMVKLSEAKGWSAIKIRGHKAFRQKVWESATLQGIKVEGYRPSQQEINSINRRLDRLEQNSIESLPHKTQESPAEVRTADQPSQTLEAGRGDDSMPVTRADVVLLEHGRAKYKNDPSKTPSYFVRIKNGDREKTLWGVGLEKALNESHAKLGDRIVIESPGKKAVTVVDDETKKTIAAHRNDWLIYRTEDMHVARRVADSLVDAQLTTPENRTAIKGALKKLLKSRAQVHGVPQVGIYDRHAPSMDNPNQELPQQNQSLQQTR